MTDAEVKESPSKNTPALCKMSERQIGQMAEVRNAWSVTPPAGTKVEALENPASWVNLTRFLRARDHVEAMPEDGAWLAEFVVLQKTAIGATLFRLNYWDLSDTDVADTSEYFVKWRGPAAKFSVMRESDKAVLKDGFDDKGDAERWMVDNA